MADRHARRADLVLTGVRASSLTDLATGLDASGVSAGARWLASDLSLGAWRGQQAAVELSAQLRLGPGATSVSPWAGTPSTDEARRRLGADLVGVFIDSESSGSRSVRDAHDQAARIGEALSDVGGPTVVLILLPRAGFSLEPEDAHFLYFLATALQGTRHALRLISTDSRATVPALPRGARIDWTGRHGEVAGEGVASAWGLLPAVVSPEMLALLGATQAPATCLGGGYRLVPPEQRTEGTRADFDRLGARVESIDWLDAYCQARGSPYHLDPWRMCAAAWRRVAEGGPGVADRLMLRAAECVASPEDRARLLTELQGLRIAMQEFDAAATVPPPGPELSAPYRAGLLQMRGWALTMLGRGAEGAACLDEAKELSASGPAPERRMDLYVRNITALARLRTGRTADAFDLERGIESELDACEAAGAPDWHLRYINALNQARLHRYRGRVDEAWRYYRQAFATVEGIRSESDAFYFPWCEARLHETAGHPREALAAMLRAVLAWLSAEIPEALAPRAASAVVGRRVRPSEIVTEEVAEALDSELREAARAANIAIPDGQRVPDFVRADRLRPGEGTFVLAAGWSVIASPTSEPSPADSAALARLRGTTFSLLTALHSGPALTSAQALGVDDGLGSGIPRERADAITACLRLGIEQVDFLGHPSSMPTGVAGLEMYGQCRLHVSGAVASIVRTDHGPHGATCHFKRYRPPIGLGGRALDVTEHARNGGRVDRLPGFDADTVDLVRRLEKERVVRLDATDVDLRGRARPATPRTLSSSPGPGPTRQDRSGPPRPGPVPRP